MRRLLSSTLPLVAILACSSSDDSSSISKTIGPEGGTIDVTLEQDSRLGGTQLVIPAGALAAPTTITISHGVEIAQNGESSRGPSVRLSPDGTTLAVPATLRVPQSVALQNDPGVLYFAAMSGGTHSEIPVTGNDAKGSRANISHFSDYELVSVTSNPQCEAAVKEHIAHPGVGDEKTNWFCYKSYACRVCKDNTCGDDIGAGTAFGGCGGAFPLLGDCLTDEWNPQGVAPPILPGCIEEAPLDPASGDRRMCCSSSDPPAPTAPAYEPKDSCSNVCGAQGSSNFGVQVDCTSTVPTGATCSGSTNMRWSGKDTTTCDWYVAGGLVSRDLEDATGQKHSLSLSGFPVGTQPPLPGSLGQGQTCPNKDPQIGVSVKVEDELPIPVELTCADPAGGSQKAPIVLDLVACQAWLCTECQTHTKDFFKSAFGGGLFCELQANPGVDTKAGDPFPPVKCTVNGQFNLGGCSGGLCK